MSFSVRTNMIAERALKHSLLVPPYGGNLVDLLVPVEELDELRSYASRLPSLQISERSVCDLELLACGRSEERRVGKERRWRGAVVRGLEGAMDGCTGCTGWPEVTC